MSCLSCLQVLGDYNRQNKTAAEIQKFIREIENISSQPLRDHFFNVSDEFALLTIVDALGSRIFALEGIPHNTQTIVYITTKPRTKHIHVFNLH